MSDITRDWPSRVLLHPTAFVAPGAIVVGDVTLGARSSVWFQCVLRGDSDRIEVGEDSNIQDQSVVHMDEKLPAIIGHRVTIGHGALIHGCVIEDDCLIGMGAILLSGSRIGRGSLVAAGALVREHQVIPPAHLVVGAPARVAGPVREPHVAAIKNGHRHYAALAQEYIARGFGRPSPPPTSPAGWPSATRGPMSEFEWASLNATLAASPDLVAARFAATGAAAWEAAPGAGWSARRVVEHLRDADVLVHAPRIARVLAADQPALAMVDLAAITEAGRPGGARAALAAWGEVRSRLVAILTGLGPREWSRGGRHSTRGPIMISDMVRDMVEHDLGHRRQIERALAGTP